MYVKTPCQKSSLKGIIPKNKSKIFLNSGLSLFLMAEMKHSYNKHKDTETQSSQRKDVVFAVYKVTDL